MTDEGTAQLVTDVKHPPSGTQTDSSGYARLEDQIRWSDRSSLDAQRAYRRLRVVQIVVAAAIPVVSLLAPDQAIYPGALGAVILILEGFQELGMYRQNWQRYRSMCEALRSEKYLFMEGGATYAGLDPTEARQNLAERVEMILSQEHGNWVTQFKQAGKAAQKKS